MLIFVRLYNLLSFNFLLQHTELEPGHRFDFLAFRGLVSCVTVFFNFFCVIIARLHFSMLFFYHLLSFSLSYTFSPLAFLHVRVLPLNITLLRWKLVNRSIKNSSISNTDKKIHAMVSST